MKILILAVILLVTLILGCTEMGSQCTHPYIESSTGSCCLDANENNICDKYEKASDTTTTVPGSTSII